MDSHALPENPIFSRFPSPKSVTPFDLEFPQEQIVQYGANMKLYKWSFFASTTVALFSR